MVATTRQFVECSAAQMSLKDSAWQDQGGQVANTDESASISMSFFFLNSRASNSASLCEAQSLLRLLLPQASALMEKESLEGRDPTLPLPAPPSQPPLPSLPLRPPPQKIRR